MRRFILLLILLAAYMAVSEMDFREQAVDSRAPHDAGKDAG